MPPEKFFHELLELGLNWEVTESRFDHASGTVFLEIRETPKLWDLVDKHLPGILAHWKWGVTNAFMQGLNRVFSATKRKARGYRSTTHLTTMLYFVAGKLRLPQC